MKEFNANNISRGIIALSWIFMSLGKSDVAGDCMLAADEK
jgi:hypothetical protein